MIVHFGNPASKSNKARLRTLSKNENSRKVSFFVSVVVNLRERRTGDAKISDSAYGNTHELSQ
jgi:hypothetical protein